MLMLEDSPKTWITFGDISFCYLFLKYLHMAAPVQLQLQTVFEYIWYGYFQP